MSPQSASGWIGQRLTPQARSDKVLAAPTAMPCRAAHRGTQYSNRNGESSRLNQSGEQHRLIAWGHAGDTLGICWDMDRCKSGEICGRRGVNGA